MRISGLLGAVVALGLSTAANAASITILPPGDLGPPAGYGSGATFNGISAQPYGSTAPSGSFVDGGAAFSGSGVVMNNGGAFIEVQGTAEGAAFSKSELDALLSLAEKGIGDLVGLQKQSLGL